MADVLRSHSTYYVRAGSVQGGEHMVDIATYETRCQTCGPIGDESQSAHQAAALSAAGFGPVQEAFAFGWREGKGIPTPVDTRTGELFHDQAQQPTCNPYRKDQP